MKLRTVSAIILPGILVAATGVGAGDLITASLAGMRVGFVILWAIPLGVLLKWVLTEGIARWQLATGTTVFEGWIDRLGAWIQWVFLAYLFLWSFVVGGALINACGVASGALLPLTRNPVTDKIVWGIIHTLAGIGLVYAGGFKVFEKVMGASVGIMFVTVLLTAVGMKPDWAGVARGLVVPVFPPGELKWILGLLGGVGGTVTILSYGYWIREKGRTGREGVRISRIDLTVAYALTGLFSIAMVIIASRLTAGTAKGVEMAVALGSQIGSTLGTGAKYCFLLGFWAAVFSSLLGVWQGVPYLFADFMHLRRIKKGLQGGQATVSLESTRDYKIYLWAIGILPVATLWLTFEAVQVTYAVMGAFFMPLVALTLLILNNRREWVGPGFRNGIAINILLVFTLLFFGYSGALQIKEKVFPAARVEKAMSGQ